MPINNMFSTWFNTWFNTWFGSWFSIWGNNIQSITKQQKYPWLNAEQVKRLEASVNGLTWTAKTQQLQKNYRAMIQIINDQNINDNRTAVNNERFKNSLNKKDARECRFDQSACRQSDLVDLVKSVKWLKASTDENTVMTKLMQEMSIRGVEMDSLNNYLDKWDEAFLYEMGLAQQPQQSNALSIKWTVADNEWGEWNDNLFGRFETEQYDKNASLGENALTFGKNLLKSWVNVLSDVWNMIVNPLDTANALWKTAVGGVANLLWVDEDMAQWGDRFNSANDTADQVWQFFSDRYGGWEQILNTLFTDPVWVISDAATLISWWAGAVKWIAWWAAKATAKAWLKGASKTLTNVSKNAGKISKTALNADPYSVAMKLEMKPIAKTIDYAKKVPWASKVMKEKLNEALDKAVWLDENTKRNIQNNPFSKEVWQKAKTWIDANWLPEKSTEVSKQLITDVADRVQETMKKQMAELWETWPMYQPLKEAWFSVDLTDLKAWLDNMLNEYWIKIEDWKLDFSKTAIDGSEANNIKKIYDRVQSTDAPMSMTEYLERFRKTISDMVDFNTNNRDAIWKKLWDTPWDKVLKWIRESANKLAHEQVPALKDLDAVFKKQTDLIKEVTDGIVYKDKTKMGAVRDNINQIIKNLDEPNRRVLKNRLEKVLPWIEEEVKAINMLPKLIDRYYKPSKMQQTLTSSAWAAVWGTIGWIPWWILWAGAWYILSNRIDKLKSNKWDKVISTTSEEGVSKMSDIQSRIANNEKISQAQKAFLWEISEKLKAWKQVKEAEITRIISEVAWAEEWKELAVLDKAIKELETLWAKEEVKQIKDLREWVVKNIDEQAEMNRYAEEFEAEKQNIINESSDQRLPEFKRRIYQLWQEERRIWSVAWKKIWKNFEGKDYHRQQQTEWLRKKEAVIKEIQDYYNVDQFEASEIYDRIERQASADDLGFSGKPASSKTAKYWAEENITPQIDDERLNKDPVDIDLDMMHERWKTETQQSINNLRETIDKWEKAKEKANWDMSQWNIFDDDNLEQAKKQLKDLQDTWDFYEKNQKYQKYWTANPNEKGISATEWLNIRNFKNWKSVKELANQYWIDTKIVDSISTPEWQRAYWMYWDRLITLSKDLKESTVPHELLHGVFDMVDSKRRTSILEWIQKKLNVDNVQAEEWLADNFSEYYRTGKFWTKWLAKWLVEKVKQFFYQVKSYIDGTYKNEKQIRQLFDDIIDWKIEWEYGVYSDPKFQSVWHGSSADFERFDSTHMWEWEWAQAHGWGHYVAKNKETWMNYATLNERRYGTYNFTIDGKPYKEIYKDLTPQQKDIFDSFKAIKVNDRTIEEAWKHIENKADTRQYELAKKILNDIPEKRKANPNKPKEYYDMMESDVKSYIEYYEKYMDDVNSLKDRVWTSSNLYEVEIPDPIKKDTPTWSNYLEEDGKITKTQLNKIADALEDYTPERVIDKWEDLPRLSKDAEKKMADRAKESALYRLRNAELDWAETYRALVDILWSDKAASQFLNKIWYDWIHYFWGRDWEAYVIFNDDALQITKHHKY